MAKEKTQAADLLSGLLFQGWLSVAIWMGVGLLLEGLLGYKIPAYLQDEMRRELFRLGHAHGTLFGVVLIIAAISIRGFDMEVSRAASRALRVGSVMMPVGFFLAGVWHPEGDPGLAIWLVPPGAVLIIFGTVTMALASRNKEPQPKGK